MLKVDKYIGIPFVDHGRDFSGCDCWGLVMLVYKSFGITLPEFNISCDDSKNVIMSITNNIDKLFKRTVEPKEKCLVLMSTEPEYRGSINHLGIYIGNKRFLHTFRKTQSCVTKTTHPFWSHKIKEFYIWNP